MKKMYIAPAIEVENTDLTSMIAESLKIDASKSGANALVREDNAWDIWDNGEE